MMLTKIWLLVILPFHSTATAILHHHPISMLLVGLDTTIQSELDSTLNVCQRINLFNPNTYMDYLLYKVMMMMIGNQPIPTSGRLIFYCGCNLSFGGYRCSGW